MCNSISAVSNRKMNRHQTKLNYRSKSCTNFPTITFTAYPPHPNTKTSTEPPIILFQFLSKTAVIDFPTKLCTVSTFQHGTSIRLSGPLKTNKAPPNTTSVVWNLSGDRTRTSLG